MTRRRALRLWMAGSERPEPRGVLVNLFLRGGADGLNLVPPHAEDAYYSARPSLAIARPDGRSDDRSKTAIDLDGFFGLHPALRPLKPLYDGGQLAIVHAVGSDDRTRSHFEAQDLMERGGAAGRNPGSGWLARHLRTRAESGTPLAAVAIGETIPESLRGAPGASAVRRVDAFSIQLPPDRRATFDRALHRLYEAEGGQLGAAGLQVLESVAAMNRLDASEGESHSGAAYPEGELGDALRQVARLIRARVGLEIACVELGGWDTHFVQATLFGSLAGALAQGLAAFAADLASDWNRTTIAAMTEFGRRVRENVSLGTDHGRAGVMFVLGGGVRGGRVIADWPGVAADRLEGPGDVRVTTDYRDVLGEIVAVRLGNERVAEVFPGHTVRPIGIV